MRGKVSLVGVEFGDMAEVLFAPAELEGRVFTLVALERRLKEITSGGRDDYAALKKVKDIDRALPRLVVAVTLAQEFGYSRLALTERELGTGLIIEAGMKTRRLDMVPHATAPGRSRDAVFAPYRPDPRLYSIRDRHVSFARSKPFTVTRPARAPLGWKAPGGDPKAVRRPSGRKVVASFPAHR
jgi:hypothetical protein